MYECLDVPQSEPMYEYPVVPQNSRRSSYGQEINQDNHVQDSNRGKSKHVSFQHNNPQPYAIQPQVYQLDQPLVDYYYYSEDEVEPDSDITIKVDDYSSTRIEAEATIRKVSEPHNNPTTSHNLWTSSIQTVRELNLQDRISIARRNKMYVKNDDSGPQTNRPCNSPKSDASGPRTDSSRTNQFNPHRAERTYCRSHSAMGSNCYNNSQRRAKIRPSTAHGSVSSYNQAPGQFTSLSRRRSASAKTLTTSRTPSSRTSGYRTSLAQSYRAESRSNLRKGRLTSSSKDLGISLSSTSLNSSNDRMFLKTNVKNSQFHDRKGNNKLIGSYNKNDLEGPMSINKGQMCGEARNTQLKPGRNHHIVNGNLDTSDSISQNGYQKEGGHLPAAKELQTSYQKKDGHLQGDVLQNVDQEEDETIHIENISPATSIKGQDNEKNYTPKDKMVVCDIVSTWYKYGVEDKVREQVKGKQPRFGVRTRPHYWNYMRGHEKDTAEMIKQKQIKARRLFHWAYRLVCMVLHYQRGMISISSDITTWSAVESQWHTLHVSSEARKLVFNRDHFAQNKALTRMPRWAKEILDKPPSDRTETECKKLHAMLRGHLKNFDKFTEKIQLAMCRAFMYYRVGTMRVILRQGHTGLNFYFIYSGSLFVNLSDVNEKGEKFSKTEAILSKGDSFGEVALLKEVPRSATVTCREECELLVVDKTIFSEVCPKIFDIELAEKHQFIRKMPVFHHKYWSEEAINNMCFDAQIQQYKTGKVISPTSAEDEWMYVCMEGSGRVIKCLALNEVNPSVTPDREPLSDRDTVVSLASVETDIKKKSELEEDTNNNNKAKLKRKNSSVRFSDQSRPTMVKRKSRASMTNLMRSSGNLQSKRDQMFNSMNVTYNINPLPPGQLTSRQHQGTQQMIDRVNKSIKPGGVMTLTGLINHNKEVYKGSCDFVYLDIGSLGIGEIFDLAELLAPSDPETKTSMILVSSGCKVLRVKKQVVMGNMTVEAVEHAKYLARNSMYPSNEVLIKSFHEREQWDSYKQSILKQTVQPYSHLKRHQHALRHLGGNSNKILRQQSARVIRSLKSEFREERDEALEENLNEDALAYVLDLEGEFESRMLNEATVINEKLAMKPMMPDVTRRTSPLAGKSLIITPSNTRYGGVGEILAS